MSLAKHMPLTISDYFHIFVEKSHDVIWVRSPDYNQQIYMSPVYEQIWGRPCQELYEHPERWEDFLHPDDKARLALSVSQRSPAVSPDDVFIERYRIIRPDGTIRWIEDKSFPLFKNNKLLAFAGIAEDITEQVASVQQIQEAKEIAETANLIKTEFIQNMQHDLRTPTSGLMSMLEILALEESAKDRRETLFLLHDAAKKIHEICNEIIDFENTAQQNNVLVIKKLSIEHIVRGIVELNKPAAITRNLSLEFTVDPKIPAVLKSDPKRISRLLINLVGNAIKFTKVGGITIHAKLIKIQDKDVIVQFEIRDTGIGVPSDKKDLIYEKFIRLMPSNEGYYKGSGLGLNIVKRYVDELEGEIDLHSELDKGTVFYVTLPFKKPLVDEIYDEDPINPQGAEKALNNKLLAATVPTEIAAKAAQDLKLLLIEDDPLARMAALTNLAVVNAQITTAENVARALQSLDETKFDLVISDLGLPDGTGNDIVATVKADPSALNYNTPFLALTAHSNPEKKAVAEHAGFLLVMTKPLAKERVVSVVDAYVHKKAVPETEQAQQESAIDALSVIDLALGEELASHATGLALELLDMLADELPKEMLLIQRAYGKNDIQTLRDLFHKIKGGLCYCGVPRLQKALGIIHDRVKEVSQVSEIEPLFAQLYNEVNLFLDAHQQLKRK